MDEEQIKNIEFEDKLRCAERIGVPNLNSIPYGDISELERRISIYLSSLDFERRKKLQMEYQRIKKRWDETCDAASKEVAKLVEELNRNKNNPTLSL